MVNGNYWVNPPGFDCMSRYGGNAVQVKKRIYWLNGVSHTRMCLKRPDKRISKDPPQADKVKENNNEKERFYVGGAAGRYRDHSFADGHSDAGSGQGQNDCLPDDLRDKPVRYRQGDSALCRRLKGGVSAAWLHKFSNIRQWKN
jgi:hypothetical protein